MREVWQEDRIELDFLADVPNSTTQEWNAYLKEVERQNRIAPQDARQSMTPERREYHRRMRVNPEYSLIYKLARQCGLTPYDLLMIKRLDSIE